MAQDKWTKVDQIPPVLKKSYILLYTKGKQKVMTEGYLTDEAEDLAIDTHPAEFWRKHGRGLTFFDYADRQIQALSAKGSKNRVTHYREKPELPKD